jgi:hypothetical protein
VKALISADELRCRNGAARIVLGGQCRPGRRVGRRCWFGGRTGLGRMVHRRQPATTAAGSGLVHSGQPGPGLPPTTTAPPPHQPRPPLARCRATSRRHNTFCDPSRFPLLRGLLPGWVLGAGCWRVVKPSGAQLETFRRRECLKQHEWFSGCGALVRFELSGGCQVKALISAHEKRCRGGRARRDLDEQCRARPGVGRCGWPSGRTGRDRLVDWRFCSGSTAASGPGLVHAGQSGPGLPPTTTAPPQPPPRPPLAGCRATGRRRMSPEQLVSTEEF